MNFLVFFLIFFLWRVFDSFIIFFSSKTIPYLGFFPYKEELVKFNLPHLFSSLANFDGIHYLLIAKNGYRQWEQAFFPLYPLLIRIFNPVFKNELITGLSISHLSFLIGLSIFAKYLKMIDKKINPFQVIIFLLLFPTSFFFSALYTEGLFFFLFTSSLYFLKKEKYFLAFIFALLTSLTRLIGVFLIIPILFKIIKNSKDKNKKIFLLFSPVFGLGIYCFYLWKTTGDPLMFFHSQPAFGANRSTNIIILPQVVWRYLKIFFTASFNFQYFISLFEFLIFFLVFFVLIIDFFENLKIKNKNFDLIALNIFSLVNLILPTLTGTFSSIPRYSLFSLSFFIFISKIKNQFLKLFLLMTFFLFHILILGFFSQGYFVS